MDASRPPPTISGLWNREDGPIETLAVDLAKQSLHVHGVTGDGAVVSRSVGRAKLLALVERPGPRTIAMEACAASHNGGRVFVSEGFEVRLVNPRFVKPFVRGSKIDAVDAEAIFDAASRPTMRFAPVRTTEQPHLRSLHRVRDRPVAQRTSLVHHARGLLAEYGLAYPKSVARFGARPRGPREGRALGDGARYVRGAS